MTYVKDVFGNDLFERYFVGADRLMKQFNEAAAYGKANYPPFNVKKIALEDKYILELAVAGFTEKDIDITVADGKLTIKGNHETLDQLDVDKDIHYVYRGISDRAFTRQFTLADTIQVESAVLVNGMLTITLVDVIPDHKKPKKIEIKSTQKLLTE
jgi:molecular chaperone IbpA